MKKLIYSTFIIYTFLFSCTSKIPNNAGIPVTVKIDSSAKVAIKSDTLLPLAIKKVNSQNGGLDSSLREKIIGIWAFVGDENATFVLEKNKIIYPDHNASYNYSLAKDTIKIKFDGFDGKYLVKKRGNDTLILVGDDIQTYYRFKR